MRLSLIVPVYNEIESVGSTLLALWRIFDGLYGIEILLVDDGSTDGSFETLTSLIRDHSGNTPTHLLRHEMNLGYGATLKTGIRHSRGVFLAITDADGTYPNDRLPDLLDLAESSQADMIVGARTGSRVTYSKLRSIPKFFLRRWVEWLCSRKIPDMNSGFRIMRRDAVVTYVRYLPDGFSFTTTITIALIRNQYRVSFIPIDYARRQGNSKIKPFRDTLRFTELILRSGVYFAPLRLFLPVAAALGVAAIASACWDIFVSKNLADKTVILLMFALNTTMFALLADLIDKRNGR